MKVRIAYAVDLDEVPEKVAELVALANMKITMQTRALERIEALLLDGQNTDISLQTIDQVRMELASADQGLSDAVSILTGYIETKNQPKPQIKDVNEENPDVL